MIVLATVVLFILAVLLEGLALSVLWGWFIVPVFAAPALRIPYAIGLAIVVGLLTSKVRKSEDSPDLPEALTQHLIAPLIFLGFGWIVKLFV